VDKINLLCIGNSHTAGFPLFDPLYGGDPKSSYEYWLKLHLSDHFSDIEFDIHNEGRCGQVSREILRRLNNTLSSFNYDLVIFWAGANDVALGYTVNRIWENLWQAYEFSVKKSKAFMLVTIPPMNWPGINANIVQLNEEIRNHSNINTYKYADVYSALVLEKEGSLNPNFDAGDGVHLSIDGYEQVGQEIFKIAIQSIQGIKKEEY